MPIASAPYALPWAISARIRLVPSWAAVTFTAPRASSTVMTSGFIFFSTAFASAASRILRAMSRVSSAIFKVSLCVRGGLLVGVKPHRQCAGDVKGGAISAVLDLMPAGGAVGNHERFGLRAAHGGQEREFGHLDRGVVSLGAIAERAGHAAATGLDGFNLQARNEAKRLFDRLERAKGFLVTVAVHHRFFGDR